MKNKIKTLSMIFICMFSLLITFYLSVKNSNDKVLNKEDKQRASCYSCKQKDASSVCPNAHKSEPPGNYFKDWYHPYSEWTPEMQNRAIQQIEQMPDDNSLIITNKMGKQVSASFEPWVQKGPFGIEHNSDGILKHYSGRVTSFDYNSGKLYFGSANGGFVVKPDDPNVIFLGTGEYRAANPLYPGGSGVFKTTNGGIHWDEVHMPVNYSRIRKVTIEDSHLFVVGDKGAYRSTDWGSSWNMLVSNNSSDIAIARSVSYILVGVKGMGIWKSTNKGVNATKIPCSLFPGLDSTKISRISVAISQSSPAKAYVQFGCPEGRGRVLGVYRTNDSGKSWINITPVDPTFSGLVSDYLVQQDYNNVICVHPTNSNIVWSGGAILIRTSNGGTSWKDVGYKPYAVHTDNHALRYVNNRLYVGCDGGIFYTDDEGSNWNSSMNEVLPITQFYNIAVKMDGGELQCGGTQDNGNVATSIANPNKWVMKRGGDGIDAAIDQLFPDNYYFTHNGGNWRTRTTNGRVNWSDIGQPMQNNKTIHKIFGIHIFQFFILVFSVGNYSLMPAPTFIGRLTMVIVGLEWVVINL